MISLRKIIVDFFSSYKHNYTKLTIHAISSAVLLYILLPTYHPLISLIFPTQNRRKDSNVKRKDKYTTGLVNSSTYCYANSSIQALAALPKFTIYLNDIRKNVHELLEQSDLVKTEPDQITQEHSEGCIKVMKRVMPLHFVLSEFLLELQTLVSEPRAISIKPIINILGSILGANLNNGQQDSHEITQIILETLNTENQNLNIMFKGNCSNYLPVPKFPFIGSQANSLYCLKCGRYSTYKEQKFMVLSLQTPQSYSTSLLHILKNDQLDEIENYACLVCQIRAILHNEEEIAKRSVQNENQMNEIENLSLLKELFPHISINEDISEDLLYYIKSYNKNGFDVYNKVKSKIIKRTVITKVPDILIIHLSRSSFNGMVSTRNSCHVEYETKIDVQSELINNENRITKHQHTYQLQSIVKHTGTHSQGHYQCYRRKPHLVKLSTALTATGIDVGTSGFQSNDEIQPISTIINKTPIISSQYKFIETSAHIQTSSKTTKSKTLKTIKQYPFWKISDTSVSEATEKTLLNEKKYIYMLYYENTRNVN